MAFSNSRNEAWQGGRQNSRNDEQNLLLAGASTQG